MKPSDTPLSLLSDTDISFVGTLVKEAGHLAASMRQGVVIKEKTGPHDRVTEADYALSNLITSKLKEKFPEDLLISEEDSHPAEYLAANKVWLIDPIDGTDNYITNDGQYSVMIGLVVDCRPVFGWVYAPWRRRAYFGGPGYGAWMAEDGNAPQRCAQVSPLETSSTTRIMMGFRDRKSHPWVNQLPNIEWVKSGSVGLKVAKVLHDEADMFIHLSGKLKKWDTAAPAAIALGAGLEVGRLEADDLPFELDGIQHGCSVIMGRTGSLAWSRAHLQQKP